MSQRSARLHGHLGNINVPRAWIILALGIASWAFVAALVAATTTSFQALSSVLG